MKRVTFNPDDEETGNANVGLDEENIETNDEFRSWSLQDLREQFDSFEKVYTEYVRRLQLGYFGLFLILQFLLSGSYVLLLYFENGESKLKDISPDIFIYGVTTIVPLIALFIVKEANVVITSYIAYVLIYIINLFLPLYHYYHNDINIGTPLTTHLVIASYIFFAIDQFIIAIVGGGLVTATHIILSGTITFQTMDAEEMARTLAIELLYFGCINGLGCYFRYLNEIMHRRSFLAKKEETRLLFDRLDKQAQQQVLIEAILPKDLAQDIMTDKTFQEQFLSGGPRKTIAPFEYKAEYIKEHQNVTVLYADIVNYTEMTTSIKTPTKLVQILNDLYGSFDDDSEVLDVMRIKMLGDCYYCVAGIASKIPDKDSTKNEDHANACIRLGLRMIKHIREIAVKQELDLNMRIGIHTGNILSALIGRTKWQFEIWSKDVQLANTMESTGFPGKIHITQETMDELVKMNCLESLNNNGGMQNKNTDEKYFVYPTNAVDVHSDKLKQRTSKTYMITAEEIPNIQMYDVRESENSLQKKATVKNDRRKFRVSGSAPKISGLSKAKGPRKDSSRQSGNANISSIKLFDSFEKKAQGAIREAIKEMPLSKYEQWFKEEEINSAFLVFKTARKERKYVGMDDQLYKYYIFSVLLVLICFIAIRFLAIPHWENTSLLSITTALILLIFGTLLWLPSWESINGGQTISSEGLVDERIYKLFPKWTFSIAPIVVDSCLLRIIVYIILVTIFTGCFVIELVPCNYTHFADIEENDNGIIISIDDEKCYGPWNITENISLILIMSFLFLRMHIVLKFLYSALITVAYSCWVWFYAYNYYNHASSFLDLMSPALAYIIYIVYLTVTLHFIDRQADYLNRLEFKWNSKLLKDKKKDAELQQVTLDLLRNVMPFDVAFKYLRPKDDSGVKKFYSESYKSAAVMFATIVDLNGSEANLNERLVLMTINEIISDFDQILLNKYNGKVEKIKLANMKTYVACAGLTPGVIWKKRKSLEEDAEYGIRVKEKQDSDEYLTTLLNFAVDIRKQLAKHNKETNFNHGLRIGIADGALTAGVVGIKKPSYDIWGDCVNVASRMDSSAIPGKIHVWSSTRMVLRRNEIKCTFNKNQMIKGKGWLDTYYVALDENGDIIKKEFKKDDSDNDDEDEDRDLNVAA